MASDKEYLIFVLELLRAVNNISYKKMMGEYMFYQDGLIFGGIYDNRFLLKKTKSNEHLGLKEVVPYPGAKNMLLIDSEDPDEIKEIVTSVIKDLK